MMFSKLFKNHSYTISDQRILWSRYVPFFVRAYVETGTGKNQSVTKNITAYDNITFTPRFNKGITEVSTAVKSKIGLLNVPFGIAPMGMPGLVHPKADVLLSSLAANKGMPYCLSTLGNVTPEELAKLRGGKVLSTDIFQLYPPKSQEILDDLLLRVEKAGFNNLLVTIDIPAPSRREHSKSYGLKIPFSFSLNLIIQSLLKPRWLLNQIINGFPRLKTVEQYSDNNSLRFVSSFAGNRLGGNPSWSDLQEIRRRWSGTLILKGVLSKEDALIAKDIGFDVVYVSNHGGRQFDGTRASLEALKDIKNALDSNTELWFDGGVRDGLDILKALAIGADLVFLGRPFLYGLYDSDESLETVYSNLENQFKNNMFQLGVSDIEAIHELTPNK